MVTGRMAADGEASERPLGEGNYRLDVTDFGPIAKASVEFRPLTVFVGPSNTGKSYLAVLAYALHRGVAGAPSSGVFGRRKATWQRDLARPNDTDRASLREWLRVADPAATERVTDFLRAQLQEPPGLKDALVAETLRCFGIDDLKELRRRGNANVRPVVRLRRASAAENGYELDLGPQTRLSGSGSGGEGRLFSRDDWRTRDTCDG